MKPHRSYDETEPQASTPIQDLPEVPEGYEIVEIPDEELENLVQLGLVAEVSDEETEDGGCEIEEVEP